jgi:hypothetical protein
MAKAENPPRGLALQVQLRAMEARVAQLTRRLTEQETHIRALTKAMETRARREDVVLRALGIGPSSKKGDRGAVGRLDSSVTKFEGYLLKTGDRIESILKILGTHRENLEKLNKKLSGEANNELLRVQLDLMRSNVTILALAGIELDPDLISDIDDLKKSLEEGKATPEEFKRRKGELDRRYAEEIKRYDLTTIYGKKKIPGYV